MSARALDLPRQRGANFFAAAFSLVEVVAAIGIFAVGIVAVLGVFAPVVQSIRTNRDTESAAGVANALVGHLRLQPFLAVAAALKTSAQFQQEETSADYDPTTDAQVFYADEGGDKIGRSDDPMWVGSSGKRHFEIRLLRNEELSPPGNDGTSAWLAFNVRVRWPAFSPATNAGSSAAASVDRGQKQVRLFSGSVRR